MKSSAFIAIKFAATVILAMVLVSGALRAQPARIAIIDTADAVSGLSREISRPLGDAFRIVDADMAKAAVTSAKYENIFNLSIAEAKSLSDAIGCNHLVLIRSGLQRRQPPAGRNPFIEAFAAVYVIDGRDGTLRRWLFFNSEADSMARAAEGLLSQAGTIASAVKDTILATEKPPPPEFPELPPENSPLPAGFRPPIPYKRLKPEYPVSAFLYTIQATVEIEADIDAEGRIGRTRFVRWAGFGLEESVERTVRAMNWRPAYRDGKPLAVRVLLRYNFRKPAKDEDSQSNN